jgi:hypothetical protein
LVDVEVLKSETGPEKATTTKFDVNDLISRVRDFVGSIKEASLGGQRMAVSVEGFNFSVGKEGKKYDLSLSMNLSFIPKTSEAEVEQQASHEPF